MPHLLAHGERELGRAPGEGLATAESVRVCLCCGGTGRKSEGSRGRERKMT